MIDISRIENISECRKRMAAVNDELARLTSPDPGSPDRLFECYRRLHPDWLRPENTRVLIFVYLYLYDPGALTGQRMRNNLRKYLTKALMLRTPQIISVRTRNLLFCYKTFPKFRRLVEKLMAEYEKN